MSERRGVASVVSKPVTEAMTIVAIVSIGFSISISTSPSTCAIHSAVEAKTSSGRPGRGEATGTNEGITVGEKPVPVVAVVRVSISLRGSECKCHEAGDDQDFVHVVCRGSYPLGLRAVVIPM